MVEVLFWVFLGALRHRVTHSRHSPVLLPFHVEHPQKRQEPRQPVRAERGGCCIVSLQTTF